METKEKLKKMRKRAINKKENPITQKISRTWEAVLKLKGTGKIADMKAVLK